VAIIAPLGVHLKIKRFALWREIAAYKTLTKVKKGLRVNLTVTIYDAYTHNFVISYGAAKGAPMATIASKTKRDDDFSHIIKEFALVLVGKHKNDGIRFHSFERVFDGGAT
jgi:hypothetical protein